MQCSLGELVMIKEVRFKLNPNSEKDKVIIDFLSQEYSPAETIKALIYKMAVGDTMGTTIAFWGKSSTLNSLSDEISNTDVVNQRHIKESKVLREKTQNNTESQSLPLIDDDIKGFFK